MSSSSGLDVRPLSIWRLLAISFGTFLVVFLILEAMDPRWLGVFRSSSQSPDAAATARAGPQASSTVTARGRALQPAGPAARTPAAARATSPATPELAGGPSQGGMFSGRAVVVETEGQGARLRVAPAAQAGVLAVLEEATIVDLTGQEAEADERLWLEVRAHGLTGWVAADFLAAAP